MLFVAMPHAALPLQYEHFPLDLGSSTFILLLEEPGRR